VPRLSRRETEVAHLVGAGLTNRQIADRLFVSERTAEYHVEQIRNKLGYHTRAEIARWVAQSPDESAPSRLPVQLTSFIGRTRDLAAVSSLLGQTRLVTITGAGGTGKTRLALEVALRVGRDFGDGAWFVDLQSLEDEKLLVPEVAAALEVADLDRELASSRRLIVLDNCEQIATACRDLVRRILSVSPGVKVLATSREPLHVSGEGVWALQPLSSAEGVGLFVDRARLAAPDVSIAAEHSELIRSICADLDNIPLAIELAASRTRLMSVADIRARLQSRFRLLVGGESPNPRQQTLEAAVAWSYDILTSEEQLVFRRLGTFTGGFFLDSAQAVVADTAIPAEHVPSLLDSLVDRSLLLAERTPDRPTRYRLLLTMRDYARERLSEAGGIESQRAVHAQHYRAVADGADAGLRGPQQAEWLPRIEDELGEFRSAFNWSLEHDPESALAIATELGWFWGMRGRVAEGRRLLAASLQRVPTPSVRRGRALIMSGWLARLNGELEIGAAFHAESVRALSEFDDPVQLGLALVWNGEAASALNDWKTARARWTEAIDLLQPLGTSEPLAYATLELGIADLLDRAPSPARDHALVGMSMMAELGNARGHALGRMVLSYADYLDGDLDRAWTEITECLAGLFRIGAFGDLNLPLPIAAVEAVAMGRPEVGVCLGAAFEGLRSSTGWNQRSPFLEALEQALGQARDRIGDAAYSNAWQRGLAMDAGDAVNLVEHPDLITTT
jgi:predicted ATPase/DNA-binding CsgD family transcriptional regulator